MQKLSEMQKMQMINTKINNGKTLEQAESEVAEVERKMNAPKKPVSDGARYLNSFDDSDESGMM